MAVVATDRLYRGERRKDGTAVTVHVAPGDHLPLGPENAFDWGRPTDGAQALSHALARDAFDGTVTSELTERLLHEVVLTLPFTDPWVLWRHELQEWAERPKASE